MQPRPTARRIMRADANRKFDALLRIPHLLILLILLVLFGNAPDGARAMRCPRGAHLQTSTPVETFPNTELTFETWVWLSNGTAGLVEYSTKDALQNPVSTFAVAASASTISVSVHGTAAAVSLPSEHALAIATETWTHVAVTWKTERKWCSSPRLWCERVAADGRLGCPRIYSEQIWRRPCD